MVSAILKKAEEKMEASVEAFRTELAGLRSGHATPSLVERIKVEYSGVPLPLNQLASISAPEARMLIIQPWDRGSISSIEKAIMKSDLGLNPSNDGNIIRISIPPLSEERRQELIKVVRKRVEERKVILRGQRHDAMEEMKKLEKVKEISQDELKRSLDHLQKLTDVFVADIDQIGRQKESDLREV